MTATPAARPSPLHSGLIWGFDFVATGATALPDGDLAAAIGPADGLRWLHLNLADQWTRRWIEASTLDGPARELLLGLDTHQRVFVGKDAMAALVHDFERDFDAEVATRIGTMQFVLTPTLMVTARQHPVCAADIVYARIQAGATPATPAAALDLLLAAVIEVGSRQSAELLATVQASEDALLESGRVPDTRLLFSVRRRAVLLRRQLGGLRGVLLRLERDADLPPALQPVVERMAQRAAALDSDVALLDSNLRQLRDEVEAQTAARTNQNLYILSILTALLLPATLVTGFFGMNTGGLPMVQSADGTAVATVLAVGASLAVYFWLRARGFFG